MSRNRRLAILGLVCLLILAAVVLFAFRSKPVVITSTGGNYTPYTTWVVFYNADNLYGAVTNADIEALRAQLNTYLQATYGAGQYKGQVIDDNLTLLSANPNGPPSFWFLLSIDGKPGTIRVDANLSSGVAVYTLTPQPQ